MLVQHINNEDDIACQEKKRQNHLKILLDANKRQFPFLRKTVSNLGIKENPLNFIKGIHEKYKNNIFNVKTKSVP
jgi:hypothetical protein